MKDPRSKDHGLNDQGLNNQGLNNQGLNNQNLENHGRARSAGASAHDTSETFARDGFGRDPGTDSAAPEHPLRRASRPTSGAPARGRAPELQGAVWVRDSRGTYAVRTTSPSRWRGEHGCVVGPFSSHAVAARFVHREIDEGDERIFARGDSWYIDLRPIES